MVAGLPPGRPVGHGLPIKEDSVKMIVNMTEAEQRIKDEQPFRLPSDAMYGRARGALSTGSLPDQYVDDARAARYVVYSYATPVGWVTPNGTKVVPDVGYSSTTGQHQMTVQSAWDMPVRYPARGRELRPSGGGPRRGGIDDPMR